MYISPCVHTCCLPAYLLLAIEYVLLAQARPMMSCIALVGERERANLVVQLGRAVVIGRAGASPPSRATGLNFLYICIYICIYISVRRVSSTLRMRALRANVKPAHCKFKGRTFSAPAELLSVWTSPHEPTTCYAFLR